MSKAEMAAVLVNALYAAGIIWWCLRLDKESKIHSEQIETMKNLLVKGDK